MGRQSQRKKSKSLKTKTHHNATYRPKRVPIRVAHHEHTLHKLPFYCTSYAVLFFLLIFASTFILLSAHTARADQQSGVVQLSGVVKGKPPEIAAKITYPADGAHFTESQVEVRGTCLQDTYIEIYRKSIFAGMTICSADGTFSVAITLVPGLNDIKAKTRDGLGQYGPDSNTINLFLDPKPGTQFVPAGQPGYTKPMLIYTTSVQRGILLGQSLTIDYEVDGNEPPYTIAIDWGDGSPVTLEKHDKEGDYKASHTFKQSGQRTIQISGLGSKGGKASVQTIVVVHATNVPITSTSICDGNNIGGSFAEYCLPNGRLIKIIDMLWPAVLIATLMTVSFWVGEKLTYNQLRTRH